MYKLITLHSYSLRFLLFKSCRPANKSGTVKMVMIAIKFLNLDSGMMRMYVEKLCKYSSPTLMNEMNAFSRPSGF